MWRQCSQSKLGLLGIASSVPMPWNGITLVVNWGRVWITAGGMTQDAGLGMRSNQPGCNRPSSERIGILLRVGRIHLLTTKSEPTRHGGAPL